MHKNYYPKIGLEIHIQLKTNTKLFCGCKNEYGAIPNTNVCPVCLGYPGVLPSLNIESVKMALKTALALNAKINTKSRFYRKNYFYPDLPKGYQITQYSESIAENGTMKILTENGVGEITIERMNIEEEAARSIHTQQDEVLLDFNRSGIPLLEVVTEPCIESPAEAKAFLEKFRDYIRFLKISDCNMERGELRVDSNISVSRDPSELGVKVELKNLNSFKAVNEALNYEIERQIRTLKHGGKIVRETRLWDEYKGESRPMRKKEESMDYRYFPEPDLPVVILDDEFIEDIKRNMPELPDTKFERYVRIYGLSTEQARIIAFDRELSEIFDSVSKKTKDQKTVANWLTVVIPGYMRENQSITDINCEDLVRLEQSLTSGFITHNQAKEILARFFEKEIPIPISLTEFEHLQSSVTDEMLEKVVDEVLAEQKDLVEKYLSGKTSVLQAILGQCMRKLKGLGDPIKLKEILERKLK
ncbi:MAG TPA: Asp-tRNA(Asn)/Glu-tRNA(Gln) amidotransferase subunit GatB [Candidatus Hydrothermia bacterium]|nr:Asp-tRNA(Asn)/Glu-tRNA(Gln) amidotransferase subunit GatB [Candidatus Hydrothermia bacterium]